MYATCMVVVSSMVSVTNPAARDINAGIGVVVAVAVVVVYMYRSTAFH